jgi:hypothetical protein
MQHDYQVQTMVGSTPRTTASGPAGRPEHRAGGGQLTPMRSATLTITIAAPRDDVFAFLADGANLPAWASNFAPAIRPNGDGWIVNQGAVEIGLEIPANRELGTVDLHITLPSGARRAVYLRVLPNGEGAEVLFTLFHSDLRTDDDIARQNDEVAEELRRVKAIFEDGADAPG